MFTSNLLNLSLLFIISISFVLTVNMGYGRKGWCGGYFYLENRKPKYRYRSGSIVQRPRGPGWSTRTAERYRRLTRVVNQRSRRSPSPGLWHRSRAAANYSPPYRPHKMMVEPSRYDKWDRDRDRGGGGGGGGNSGGGGSGAGGAWSSRDRERDRERERQARAHQMSHAHAAEPDASSLFPAPVRVTGQRDKVSQQIQHKLGDYYLAQTFIDDPSKSIGICAEPPSPAPCRESRRESEFKKPAPNGRVHHRPYAVNKGDGASSTNAPAHRPPPIRIPNGFQTQSASESSKPPIESILKEMKSLPTPLSVIAATPRKELENKFIFNPVTNKVQENPLASSNDLKSTVPKVGLDNRIPNSRSSVSPDRVTKDLGLSESDEEVAAAAHRIGPPLSPIGSGSPSSGSSSPSDSESESSSAESSAPAPAPQPAAPPPPQTAPPALEPAARSSWGLVNFAPPPPQPLESTYDSGKELRHALADVKGKPQSPISELSDSETSSPSPGSRRRNNHRTSTASSDDDTPSHHTSSPRVPSSAPKRGRPTNKGRKSEERPAKKRRGRPPKPRANSPLLDSDDEGGRVAPPPPAPLHDMKTHIFRKVFTPKKGDEGGGKGGKGGKGKGGKGKGQVTIIEVTAPEPDDDERRRTAERRNEEALARVSPPPEPEPTHRRREVNERIQDRVSIERAEHRRSDDRHDRTPARPRADADTDKITTERTSNDRIATERTSNDRIASRSSERSRDRTPSDRLSVDRTPSQRRSTERSSSDRSSLSDRSMSDRLSVSSHSTDRRSTDRQSADKSSLDRLPTDKLPHERISMEKAQERLSHERIDSKIRLPDSKMHDRHDSKMSIDRLSENKMSIDIVPDKIIDRITDGKMSIVPDNKISIDKLSIGRLSDNKMSIDRLTESKMSIEQLSDSKMAIDRLDSKLPLVDRVSIDRSYVRAEADVGSGLKPGRGSERLEDPTSIVSRRTRIMVRVPLSRLRAHTARALQRPRRPPPPPAPPAPHQNGEVAATNHERTGACSGQTPIYYSYFERLPADALSDEERDHKYYLEEATRLRTAADREQEPLTRVMLYHESVLCFVLTGRVLELELDTKGAFTIYRETIEYIKLIHSMPQRYRASPHGTFNKLDILSLRVQALLYLRMFKMYNREVKEYNKIVNEYQQKPACAESASPLSPTPSPAGSVGSVGSGASASSGYCSLVHSVPAHAHQALLLLTKYYTFLYVAHDLWEQADGFCRLRANQDLFIAVDRKCGPLSLSSTFRHLVQYVRYAITLLKTTAPRE